MIFKKNSFTNKLLKDENLIKQKIIEEAKEVVNYKNKENLIWEIADLFYFVNVLMAKNKIEYKDIEIELESRNFKKNAFKMEIRM